MASQGTESAAAADTSPNNSQALARKAVTDEQRPMQKGGSEGLLPAPRHAPTAPATVGRLSKADSTGRMNRGLSTYVGFKPAAHEDLVSLRERRYMTGLFHLNSRMDVLDAGHHIIPTVEEEEIEEPGEQPDPNLIVYSGPDDPLNPQNWSLMTKIYQTALLGVATMVVTFASSVFSTATQVIAEQYGVSTVVATLSTSTFLLGYCLGPSIWGPASEFLGRRPPLLLSYFGFALFNIPVAVAQNLQTIMLCRFCGGLFASGPLAIVAGAYSDYWSAEARGGAITIYGVACVAGPALGPVGNFIVQSYLGWRFTAYVTAWWAFLMFILMVFTLKESFTPVLLQNKAKKLRFETKNWAIRSKLDEKQLSVRDILIVYAGRPIAMFFTEPILFLVTMYLSFVYSILYLAFGSVPYIFVEQRGEQPGTAGLVFLSIFVGAVISGAITLSFSPRYNRILHETKAISLPRERCLPMMIGAIVFPIAMFLLGWGIYVPSPWVQIVGVGMIGAGFVLIFLSGLNLLIDVYLMLANSAVAANTIVRSGMAAGFPLFGVIMFQNLGTQWAGTLLGCLALVFAPFPFVFYLKADALIKRSKYAPKLPAPGGAPPKEKKVAPPMDEKKEEVPANGSAAPASNDDLSPVDEKAETKESPV